MKRWAHKAPLQGVEQHLSQLPLLRDRFGPVRKNAVCLPEP